jgi:hypothetical protein
MATSKTRSASVKTVRPDQITITLKKTIQAVRFEPVEVEHTETYTPQPGENISEARAALYEQVAKTLRRMMKLQLSEWRAEHQKWVEENGTSDRA